MISLYITNDLIDYLNNICPRCEFKFGVFTLKFDKKTDKNLDWVSIEKLIRLIEHPKYKDFTSYVKCVTEQLILFETYGLKCNLIVELFDVNNIEKYKCNDDNILWITSNVIEKFPNNLNCKFNIVSRDISTLNIVDPYQLDELKIAMLVFFSKRATQIKQQRLLLQFTNRLEANIIVDKNNNIIDGRHRLLFLKLFCPSSIIKCIEIDDRLKDFKRQPRVDYSHCEPEIVSFLKENDIYDEYNDYCKKSRKNILSSLFACI